VAKKTKKEELDEAVAKAVGAGRELHLETVDFSDPNRPKTCLEVDFPILPINRNAAVESSSGAAVKPVFKASKWWARRPPSVFRAILIAAATKAPEDPAEAAKTVWDAFYGNHQKNEGFRKLKATDIFMGGGTTVVEGARLGMQMLGNDLNPVAWFVVTNAISKADPNAVRRLFKNIEAEVKPQIMPFYVCDCPRGHKGKWTKKKTGNVMGKDFDPLALKPEERPEYEYEGPEVIYTFWAKHGPCQATECDHRTPIMSSPVIAVKTLTVKAWQDVECGKCGKSFDIEEQDARMAPAALFVVAPDEAPYTIRKSDGSYSCSHCGHTASKSLGKAKNKKVDLTLLIHPNWLKGSPGKSTSGETFGGSVTDDASSTARWNAERAKTLQLVEVRGRLPDEITCPDTGEVVFTDRRGGTVPKKSTFTCKEETCGLDQDVLTSIKKSGKSGPTAMYAIQGYCPECDKNGVPYSGRFFAHPDVNAHTATAYEWESRRNEDLQGCWPDAEVPYGFMTHMNNGGIPNHGFTHWNTMFNERQLLVHSQICRFFQKAIRSNDTREAAVAGLGAFQQYLRFNCLFTVYHSANDQTTKHFANNNYAPKSTMMETPVFCAVGDGTWKSATEGVVESLEYNRHPWDTVATTNIEVIDDSLSKMVGGKSTRVCPNDTMLAPVQLSCRSATDLAHIENESIDLVVTDPPFGGLLHYSELSDFFYVWLQLCLHDIAPQIFTATATPKTLEAVSNRARNPDDPDAYYQRLLTESWKESLRILKPSGLLAFTFHHSEDSPWVAVLESLFGAGFILEATYPVRADTAFAEFAKPGAFGSQKIEYDIIHVCRKRVDEPQEISWARLRRKIMNDVKQLQEILEQHQSAGLQEADLQVIRRGKALEYYSKHYGKVYVEKGRDFTVREALVGINTLLDDERDTNKETPPVNAEPYTRQFLRLFADKTGIPRDQMQKFLRGTGVSPAEFTDRGWCSESQKVFYITPPLELAQKWKGQLRSGMARDFDQAMFLVGACYPDSGIRVQDTLDSPNFKPHPATPGILDWLTRHGGDSNIKTAARLAKQLYERWMAANEPKVTVQRTLFDELED
jgi:putative DNA methylase